MAMWNADVTTRLGAGTAARMGGTAAFVFAGLGLLGVVFFGVASLKTGPAVAGGGLLLVMMKTDAAMAVIGGLTEALIGIIAGFRLREGKGLVWGGMAMILVVLELIGKVADSHFGGLVINIVIAAYLFNGLRGAYALAKGRFAQDEADVSG